jgi:hypothetical protein
MAYALKGKKGMWMKPGGGGSYRGYLYARAAPSPYPTTDQQKRIGDKGRRVGKECAGKTGSAFRECRHAAVGGK